MSTRPLLRLFALSSLALASSALPNRALAWPTIDPAGNRVALLGGRWTVALPESATPALLGGDPNVPSPRADVDGLVLVDAPEGHFAIHATLLQSTRPDDLAAAIRTLPAPCEAPTYAPLGDRTDALTVRCTTPAPDGAFRPIVVFAVHSDGWVERFEAMIETSDPDDTHARDEGVAFAEAALLTLRAESVPPAVVRGRVELGRACESGASFDTLALTLPDGWVATRQSATGGDLLRIAQLVPLGAPRVMLAAELARPGTPPPRLPAGTGTLRPGAILGQPVDWFVAESEDDSVGLRQVAADLTIDCGGGSTFARALRLSTGGPTASLDSGQHILESLALTTEREHHVALVAVPSEAPARDVVEVADQGETDREPDQQGHVWSFAIGGASLVLLAAALVLRSRTTRSK